MDAGIGHMQGAAALAVFLSMFLWGFSSALAALVAQWPMVPSYAYIYLLLAMPVGLLSGNLLMGRLADAVGRKPVMIAALAVYSIGVMIVALAPSWQLLALGIGLLEFSIAGGDEPALLSYLAEVSPARSRGSLIMLVSNGANVGAAAEAAMFLLMGAGAAAERIVLVATFALALPLVLAVRARLPESPVWRRAASAEGARPGLAAALRPGKLYFLLAIAFSTVLTYGLVSWALGPYYYPDAVSLLMLVFNAGAIAGGVLGYFLIDRFPRARSSLIYYAGGLITALAVAAQLAIAPHTMWAFEALLVANGAFAQLTWGIRLVMEAELFHTAFRATSIAMVRSSAWIAYIGSLFFTQGFGVSTFLLYDVALWALGLSGVALWATVGYETRGRGIEELDVAVGRVL